MSGAFRLLSDPGDAPVGSFFARGQGRRLELLLAEPLRLAHRALELEPSVQVSLGSG